MRSVCFLRSRFEGGYLNREIYQFEYNAVSRLQRFAAHYESPAHVDAINASNWDTENVAPAPEQLEASHPMVRIMATQKARMTKPPADVGKLLIKRFTGVYNDYKTGTASANSWPARKLTHLVGETRVEFGMNFKGGYGEFLPRGLAIKYLTDIAHASFGNSIAE